MTLSARHQMEILPFRRQLLQRGGPPARPLAVRRTDTTTAERELCSVGGKWKRRERVTVRAHRPYRDRHVLLARNWNALECLLDPVAGVNSVEVQGKRINELKCLVVLENLRLIEPSACFGIIRKLRLQTLLSLELAVQHLVRHRSVPCRDLVQQYELGKAVAAVVEAPAVHAGNQPAVRMLALIEIGREPAGRGDEFRWRIHQIVWEPGGGVDLRIAVKLEPARIMMRNDVDHLVDRAQRLE